MITTKTLNNGIVCNWRSIVKTDIDYVNRVSRATIYYYLDEQHAIDFPLEAIFAEVIEIPLPEETEMAKVGVTALTVAYKEVAIKEAEALAVAPIEPILEPIIKF